MIKPLAETIILLEMWSGKQDKDCTNFSVFQLPDFQTLLGSKLNLSRSDDLLFSPSYIKLCQPYVNIKSFENIARVSNCPDDDVVNKV